MSKPVAFDLFAGGGGLTVGLKRAGFRVVGAIELEKNAFLTYRTNHPEVTSYLQDVRTLTGDCIQQLAPGRLDLLAACPPCQGFCTLTRRETEDPRNKLVLEVARLAEQAHPRCIMMENVPGLAEDRGKTLFRQLLRRLKKAGYIVRYDVLQVADYGIPQRRRRLVLLAGHGFAVELPPATHSMTQKGGLKPWRTVADALHGHFLPHAVTMSTALRAGGPESYSWHVVRDLTPRNQERIEHAVAGKGRKHFPLHLRPPCHQASDDGFHNFYGRLQWDQASVTITAGCTTLSKGRFGHPDQNRTISVREAALLQTFPIDYKICTPHMEHACDIVGNALPCDFAEIVARQCFTAVSNG